MWKKERVILAGTEGVVSYFFFFTDPSINISFNFYSLILASEPHIPLTYYIHILLLKFLIEIYISCSNNIFIFIFL